MPPAGQIGAKGRTAAWRSTKAKIYLAKLCKVLAQACIRHAQGLMCEGKEPFPTKLDEAVDALTQLHDPYDETAKGVVMKSDLHRPSSTC